MTIKFYSTIDEYGEFSNFALYPVKIGGKVWETSEHYFQAQKFVGTKYETRIYRTKDPAKAASIGRDRSLPLRKDWESVKDNVMRDVVYAKFSQNPYLKKVLLSTVGEKIVEHTENDSYWGDGGNGKGKNMLGIILMEVRSRIIKENALSI